jgi:hypothetical protein
MTRAILLNAGVRPHSAAVAKGWTLRNLYPCIITMVPALSRFSDWRFRYMRRTGSLAIRQVSALVYAKIDSCWRLPDRSIQTATNPLRYKAGGSPSSKYTS